MAAKWDDKVYKSVLSELKATDTVVGDYINSYTKIKHRCANGHLFYNRPDKVIHILRNTDKTTGCKECNIRAADNRQTRSHDEYQDLIAPLCSKQYQGSFTPIKHKCDKGHVFSAQPAVLLQTKQCPLCLTNFQKERYKGYRKRCRIGKILVSNPIRYSQHNIQADHTCIKCKHSWTYVFNKAYVTRCPNCGNSATGGAKQAKIEGKVIAYQGFELYGIKYAMKRLNISIHDMLLDSINQKDIPKIPYSHRGRYHEHRPDIYIPKFNVFVEVKSEATIGLTRFRGDSPTKYFNSTKAKYKAAINLGYDYKLLVFRSDGSKIKLPNTWWRMGLVQFRNEIKRLNH